MKTLLILRHAKSSWSQMNVADHDRSLNGRGRADAPRMGALLRTEGLVPDLIVSSTAVRAATTALAVADACGYMADVVTTRRLYHADADMYLDVLAQMADDQACVMVVGHNPGMEELVEQVTGVYESMPTAALAQVSLPIARWGELSAETEGQLINLWRPREL